jgi:hypothetical protein
LGTVDETHPKRQQQNDQYNRQDLPKPIVDENLTDAEREKIRADRAAAAELRLKKQKGSSKPKKTTTAIDTTNAPLRGPNTKPTMTWSLG